MNKSKVATLILLLVMLTWAKDCPNPTLMISNTLLNNLFNKAFMATNYKGPFRDMISNPTPSNIYNFFMGQAPYVGTLWGFGLLSLILISVFLIQVCCYNCCSVKKCGNKIGLKTYTPYSVTCSVYLYMFFCFLLTAIGIAIFIVSSDLISSLYATNCNIENTFNNIYIGTTQGSSPFWSGVDNFNTYAKQLSTNFPNVVPTLNTIFSSNFYTRATSTAAGTPFTLATTPFSCPTALATTTVPCPFPDSSSCAGGSPTQIPIFSQSYCNQNVVNSTAALIQTEQAVNSSAWQSALLSLQTDISNAQASPIDFSNLISRTSTLSQSFQNVKSPMRQTIDAINNNIYYAEIGIYTIISAIIFLSIIGFISICCVFCPRNFNCRFLLYPLWLCFGFMAIILFAASGFLLFASFTAFNTCDSYKYYTTTSGTIQTFSYYSNSNSFQILSTCFYSKSSTTTAFDAFNSSTNLPTLELIKGHYYASLPSSTFTSAVNNIQNTLAGIALNPNTVNLVGAASSQNPQSAFDQANAFAINGGGSSCSVINDNFQFNPQMCYPLLINQNPPQASCIIIDSSSSTIVTNRQALLSSSSNCLSSGTTYQADFSALLNFGNGVKSLVTSYQSDPGLFSYLSAYFNYYQAVTTLMNNYTQSLFNSFLTPYQNLLSGSSCSFLTQSLNFLVNTSCNRDFPYMYAFACLTIALASCFFMLMILGYFLTTRMEFYTFLQGDLDNYDQDAKDEDQTLQEIEMADLSNLDATNRQQLILQT